MTTPSLHFSVSHFASHQLFGIYVLGHETLSFSKDSPGTWRRLKLYSLSVLGSSSCSSSLLSFILVSLLSFWFPPSDVGSIFLLPLSSETSLNLNKCHFSPGFNLQSCWNELRNKVEERTYRHKALPSFPFFCLTGSLTAHIQVSSHNFPLDTFPNLTSSRLSSQHRETWNIIKAGTFLYAQRRSSGLNCRKKDNRFVYVGGAGAGYLLQQEALLCAKTQILVICVICGRAAGSINLKPPSQRGSACCK